MPQGNGQGPMNTGSRTGRGRGFCSGNGIPVAMNRETVQTGSAEQQNVGCCSWPQNGASGMKTGNGRRNGGGCGNKHGQR
ncbi:MAG: DUF5320 domain-containing protein [Desulfuromonadaceae bacterium]|nr:DUF5320 domain-containing protein [Desulfuromonadaceae bacterium]MDD2849480.1 DUF5320 domain-containing protein [Desulfuromonadaceae bacterium]MDD4130506.1 DUF5320 domain-containing protein [Desulfuromonadaceae bacterium]